MQLPIVDVHIEKTAGRSTRKVLIESFGAERVLHYDCSNDRLLRASDRLLITENPLQERVQRLASKRAFFPVIKAAYKLAQKVETVRGFAPEALPENFDVITGHFVGSRFEAIVSPDEATYTTVLREPLSRARSHYEHWRRTRGLTRFRFCPEYNPDVTFVDFALLPGMQNYQTASMGLPPEKFALLGVAQRLAEYLDALGLPICTDEVPHINKGNADVGQSYDPGFLRDFIEVNAADYALYSQVAEQWAAPLDQPMV